MKTKYVIAILFASLFTIVGCDKDFEQINTDPFAINSVDPSFLLANEQNFGGDSYHYPAGIVQQISLIITGQEDGGSHNVQKNDFANQIWNGSYGALKNLADIMVNTEGDEARTNVYNMAKIISMWHYMYLVDSYGDVPYSQAIKGYYEGLFFPQYDNQEEIYADIVIKLKEATDALDAGKDKVTNDMWFQGDIAKWKKFGNSLLLRMGMRYSEVDNAKAKSIVADATNPSRGGVMVTNDDNVIVPYNSTQTNPAVGFCSNSTKQNWHAGRPLVDHMKTNNDPRMQYLICLYSDPSAGDGGTRNTNPDDQIGAPYGYDPGTIQNDPLFPGGSSIYNYSMINRQTCGRVDSWAQVFTAAQTQLLMAEAVERDYISGDAKAYYENAITQALTMKDIYSETRGGNSPITQAEIDAYLAEPNIAYNSSTWEKQIGEQYWLACFLDWWEAWSNWRRTGYPQLLPADYPGGDPSVLQGDGFIHRMVYPDAEYSANEENVKSAATAIGGDNLANKVFWDN